MPFGKIGRAVAYDVDNIGEASAVERAFLQVVDEQRLDLADYIVADRWQIRAGFLPGALTSVPATTIPRPTMLPSL